MTDQSYDPFDRTFPLDTSTTTERLPMPGTQPAGDGPTGEGPVETAVSPVPNRTKTRSRTLLSDLRTGPPQRAALVVLVGIAVLTIAFIIMIFVNVSNESIIALAVIATPIASMVAAYYAVTLSIQQVATERADKEKALARLTAVEAGARETEVWASQMESGLRVAMAKLDGAGVSTVAVTRAAGTPDDFF
ncbi:hypothetical protein B7495_09490 [Cryobacterium sp. LW097]|uniref:hypothetical protein n=1 Tax=unclassified Cryobacterium TaxID=2649013 RepID=UPI000B4D3A98|nr:MULTISPECIES: hypothetical protein [unclassified Cryobacterium]ASD22293.1 hypothetical protein B7495_09490 [Cryobacterium sp. LW097]TFC57267.1 hypothetical protein E3O60_14265 [Cryobacterium sp. TMB1-7]TFC88568.1 hypothetical protein E3T19_09970 [Cryobacterium sp. TMT4-31]